MGALHTAYPDDIEVQAFYGLALAASIGQEDPVADARKALAVLEPGFIAHPDHPVYPYETDLKKVWSIDDDDNGHDNMDHSAMPGMKMN
ncbi:hypothetical protein [Tunturiibacter gelidiferens]|uniref:Uncharacterized protein n=1 Tax=Tunturiibacter gelidiferens TaxID=3069689 RepID=A0AAU7Z0Q8_9BACT